MRPPFETPWRLVLHMLVPPAASLERKHSWAPLLNEPCPHLSNQHACTPAVPAVAACAELCKATNDQIAGQAARLAGLSDLDPSVLASPLPTCQFYRWTGQPVSCGGAGMKKVRSS